MLFLRLAAVAATSLFLAGPGLAAPRYGLPAEDYTPSYRSNTIPSCDDSGVLNQVSFAFYWRELEFWHSGLKIDQIERAQEIGYRSNGVDYIPRRYCVARALFNDGHERAVKYNVIEGGGYMGFGYGVDWCVVGLDRNHAYAPDCRAAMP